MFFELGGTVEKNIPIDTLPPFGYSIDMMTNKPNSSLPLCSCGCARSVGLTPTGLLMTYATESCRRLVHSTTYRAKLQLRKLEMDSLLDRPLCKCGCGEMAFWGVDKRDWNDYIKYHGINKGLRIRRLNAVAKLLNSDRPIFLELPETQKESKRKECGLCKCGCGNLVKKAGRVFLLGHHGLFNRKDKRPRPECKCGCGELVNYGSGRWNTYIARHEHRDLEYLAKIQNAVTSRPNKLEITFDKLTPDYVEFVGDGGLWIKLPTGRYKNPDFVVSGERKLIELFGNRYHRRSEEQEIVEKYSSVGYECLVIWEHEMRDLESVFEKVAAFIGASEWQLSLGVQYRPSQYRRQEGVTCLIE